MRNYFLTLLVLNCIHIQFAFNFSKSHTRKRISTYLLSINRNIEMSDTKTDPMIRDRKAPELSHTPTAVGTSILYASVVVPIWATVMLPLTIASVAVESVLSSVFKPKEKSNTTDKVDYGTFEKVTIPATASRQYDLVVFGATGFTGKLAATYIAKTYGMKSFKWAIAGRRQNALEDVRNSLLQYDPTLKDLPLIIADSYDVPSLNKMVNQTKVVISTTGPYSIYGNDLVKACVTYGTHYCDITGETDWVRKTIDIFDNKARETGAKIVHFCGHDCVPWDLSVQACNEKLKEKNKNEKIHSIRFYDSINAQASGGTLATIFHLLKNRVKYDSKLGYDPLLKSLSQTKSTNKFHVKNTMILSYEKEVKSWIGPFIMASVMSNCIRRSNALLNYSSNMIYSESELYPSIFAGFVNFMNLILFGTVLACTPLREIVQRNLVTSPGQGPSAEKMDKGYLKIIGYCTGDQGTEVKSTIYFPTDPGYRDTARMLVESGLVLALQEKELSNPSGGVFTPAACQGKLLLNRLIATGTYFHIE